MSHYTVASKTAGELGLYYAAAFPKLLTRSGNAWKMFMASVGDDDTPKNRKRWRNRGYRVVKVMLTLEECS